MEDGSKYQRYEELEISGEILKRIMYRPKFAIYFCSALGLALCLSLNLLLIGLGLGIIALSIFVYTRLEDHKVLDIYNGFLVVYNIDDEALARKIVFDDIEEWGLKNSEMGVDAIMIRLKDGELIYKDTFSIAKAYRQLEKLMKDKSSRAVKERESRKTRLKFRNPFKKDW